MIKTDPSRTVWKQNTAARRCLFLAACAAASIAWLPRGTSGLAAEGTPSEEKRPTIDVREIFVPESEWAALLENRPERVFLSREEYEGLLAKARKTAHAPNPPRPWAIKDSEFEIRFDRDRAWIQATLRLRLLADGLQRIPLPMRGAVVHQARLDDLPAALSLVQENGTPVAVELFAEGIGEHTLTFMAAAALQVSAVRQSLTLRLPKGASCRTLAVVPGDVELTSGAVVLDRRLEANGETRFDLVLPDEETTLELTLNSRLRQDRRLVHARSVHVVEVGEASRRIGSEIAFDVLDQPVSSLELSIPEGYAVTAVDCRSAAQWQERQAEDRRALVITLREPTAGRIAVRVQGVQTEAADSDVSIAIFQPLNVTSHAAVVGLLLDASLRVKSFREAGVVRIDGTTLTSVPVPVAASAEEGAQGRLVAAWYVPWGSPSVSVRVERPQPQLDALMNLVLTVKETELSLLGEVFLTPLEEKLYETVLLRPAGWHVNRVTLSDGAAARFESFGRLDEEGRVVVRLPQGIAVGTQTRIDFQAISTVPVGSWDEPGEVVFPAFRVASATRERGAAALALATDLEARPIVLDRLVPLNAADRKEFGLTAVETALAYRMVEQPFAARFQVVKVRPRMSAELFQCFRLETVALHGHVELAYRVEGAGADAFVFSLPLAAPEGIRVSAGEGRAVKQVSHELRGDRRCWTVRLQEPVAGAVRLFADWGQEWPAGGDQDTPLPLATCEGVVYQTGIVSLEATADLEVNLIGEARRVDEGELAAAEYQPGPGLLAVVSYGGDPPPLAIRARRHEVIPIPPLLVQRAVLRTLFDNNGGSVGQADFFLLTGGVSLRLEMPRGGELWSAFLDGRPLGLRRAGKEYWLDIPAGDVQTIRHLRLVYGQHVGGFGGWGAAELQSVWLSTADAPGRPSEKLACADLEWEVLLPPGFEVLSSRGNVLRLQTEPRPILLSALDVFKWSQWGPGCGIQAARQSAHRPVPTARPEPMPSDDSSLFGEPDVSPSEKAGEERKSADGSELLLRSKADGSLGQAVAMPESAPESQSQVPQARETPLPAEVPAAPSSVAAEQRAAEATQPAPPPSSVPAKRRMQAGFGHMPIELQTPDGYQVVKLTNLGARPTVRLRLVRAFGVFGLAAVLLGGMAAICVKVRAARKGRFGHGPLLVLLTAASLIPLVPGLEALTALCDSFFLGILGAWLAWFVLPPIVAGFGYGRSNLIAVYSWLCLKSAGWIKRSSSVKTGIAVAVALLLLDQGGRCVAQQNEAGEAAVVATDPSGRLTVQILGGDPPLNLPDDAVIIPYDPAQGWESAGRRVWIPFAKYAELWKAAEEANRAESPPASPFAVGSVTYQGVLDSADVLRLRGGFDVFVYVPEPVRIPLLFGNASPIAVRMDGREAALEPSDPSAAPVPPNQPATQQVRRDTAVPMAALLYVAGKGRHRVDMEVLVPLQRNGGWRKADAVLPCPSPGMLRLTVPQAGSEVLFPAGIGRLKTVTAAADAAVEGTLLPPGNLSIHWRPQVLEAAVDPSLSARSFVVLDVREEDLRCHWATTLRFRQGERQSFEFLVPKAWEIEQIEGDNVKSWDVAEAGEHRRVSVMLLAAARDEEAMVLHLRRPLLQAGETEAEFEVPVPVVADAASHSGQIILRRGPYLEVVTLEMESVSSVPIPNPGDYAAAVRNAPVSPLGVEPQAAYSFFSKAYRLRVRARVRESDQTVDVQAVLRVGPFRRSLESRVIWHATNRPFYQGTILLPAHIHRIDQVELPGEGSWDAQATETETRLSVFLRDGILGDVPVVVRATLSVDDTPAELPVPAVAVPGVRAVKGEMAISVEPRYSVELKAARDCLPVLVSRLAWLPEDQRDQTQLALEFGDAPPAAVIGLQPRAPVVSCETIGNVRFTARAVEETQLLEFLVEQAGIRGLRFRLPAGMRECRILAPMLRSKSVTPCEDQPDSDVWVDIEFQDELMGLLRILVEQDFALGDAPHRTSIPVDIQIPDGPPIRVGVQAVTLQNAGRDEVVVAEAEEVEQAGSQRRAQLEERLRGPAGPVIRLTDAYIIRAGAKNPRLAFLPRTRATLRSAGIRVRLSDTVLTLDGNGDYRGSQQYWIENREEQFFRIQLPEGAALWSASVDGRPAKPIADEEATESNTVRIPVARTAEGDLPVKLLVKYGGSDAAIGWQNRKALPLVRTPDWTPEWSQLRVYSSDDRLLFDFGGTARKVPERELASGFEGFRKKLTADLMETLKRGDDYARVRAGFNLQILGSDLVSRAYLSESEEYGSFGYRGPPPGSELEYRSAEFADALNRAESLPGSGRAIDNRALLGSLYESQRAVTVRAGAGEGTAAFAEQPLPIKGQMPGASFDQSWYGAFAGADKAGPDKAGAERTSGAKLTETKQATPPRQAPTRQLQSRFEIADSPEAELLKRRNTPAQTRTGRSDLAAAVDDSLALGRNAAAETARRYGERYQMRQRGLYEFQQSGDGRLAEQRAQRKRDEFGGFEGDASAFIPQGGAMGAVPATAAAAGTTVGAKGRAALDVEIPARGKPYCFVAPQGEMEVRVRAVPGYIVARLRQAATILAMIAGLALGLAVMGKAWCYLARRRELAFAISTIALFLVCFTGLFGLLLLLVSFYTFAAGVAGSRQVARNLA
ncbi:MAG: hypothetical protein ACUVQK_07060 [Thermogutta sp.]